MKKCLLLVIAFITFASARGPYLDAGFGWGEIKTKIDNKDYVKESNTLLFNNVREDAFELDIKIGYGPFGLGVVPLYVAADLDMLQHNITNDLYLDNNVNFNTYVFGPSVIIYPVSIIQIGLSAGISVTTVEMTSENIEIDSDLGYMYSVSAAYDFGAGLETRYKELLGNHTCLIGVKYFGAKNPTYAGKSIKTEMPSIFIKYAYIRRN